MKVYFDKSHSYLFLLLPHSQYPPTWGDLFCYLCVCTSVYYAKINKNTVILTNFSTNYAQSFALLLKM